MTAPIQDPQAFLKALAEKLYKQGRDDTLRSIIAVLSQDSMKDGAMTTKQVIEMLTKILESPAVVIAPENPPSP
jgi:hypothetical protein